MSIKCYCCNSRLVYPLDDPNELGPVVHVLSEKISETHYTEEGWSQITTGRSFHYYFCDLNCWYLSLLGLQSRLNLRKVYPKGNQKTTHCCRCEEPMSRSIPHVSYSMITGRVNSKDSHLGIRSDSEIELAVLCPSCLPVNESHTHECGDYRPDYEIIL